MNTGDFNQDSYYSPPRSTSTDIPGRPVKPIKFRNNFNGRGINLLPSFERSLNENISIIPNVVEEDFVYTTPVNSPR